MMFIASLLFAHLVAVSALPQVFYTCDDVVPKSMRCDLKETKRQVTVRGLNVIYWEFQRADTDEHTVKLPSIIGVHGGPAYTHNYMLPLKYAACEPGRKVVLYDQAGCGESSPVQNVSENAPWLLTIRYYYHDEIPAIIEAAGIDKFYLFGHSWGTCVAQEYSIRSSASPNMVGLILAGPLSDAQFYIQAQKEYVHSTLPVFIRNKINYLEAKKDYGNPEYEAIVNDLTNMFTIRTVPWPQCFADCFGGLNQEIYVEMQGASEFTVGGVLEHWNITAKLHKIKVPTLVTRGEFDTMARPVCDVIVDQIPNAKFYEHKSSGHISFIDSPSTVLNSLREFMHGVEHPQRVHRRARKHAHADEGLDQILGTRK